MSNGYIQKEDYPDWDGDESIMFLIDEYDGDLDEKFEDEYDPTGLQDEFDFYAGADYEQ